MAKNKAYDLCGAAAILFVFFVPVLSSLFDKKAVICTFGAAALFAAVHAALKKKVTPLSKVSAFLWIVTVFSFVSLFWVSDKGAEFSFSLIFAAALMLSGAVKASMKARGRENFLLNAKKTVYYSAVFYAFVNILYQFFISEKALLYRMDFGSGSGYASAAFMIAGIMCARSVRRGREKNAGFIAALILMIYVFLMTGSLSGYIVAAAIVLCRTLRSKKRRVEAFTAAVALVLLSVTKVIYTVSKISTAKLHFSSALYGLASVFGRGTGGYNAAFALLDKAYDTQPIGILLMTEAWGLFGVAAAVCAVLYALRRYLAKPKITNFAALAILIGVFFSSAEQMVFSIPLLAAYYMIETDSVNIRIHSAVCVCASCAGLFMLYLAAARVPFALGRSAYEVAEFQSAAEYYTVGAKMELFSSEGWEKAYEAYGAVEHETQGYMPRLMEECLENAMRFNPRNTNYSKKLADVYSSEKNYAKALEIWDDIIEECDDEYLYPMYAEKISDLMAAKVADADAERELYAKLSLYADKCLGDETKRQVNDILARAQRYYVVSMEGGVAAGDMYVETETEEASSEAETE